MAKTEMSDQAYADFVAGRFDEAASTSDPIVFLNRGTFHARVVLGHIVTRSRSSLRILSGKLSSEAYDANELRHATRVLREPIKVLVADRPRFGSESALCSLQPEIERGAVEVRWLQPLLDRSDYRDEVCHVAIGDATFVRAESNALTRTATVVLNAGSTKADGYAEKYVRMFDLLWAKSDKLGFADL